MEAIGVGLVSSIGVLVVEKLATFLEQEAQLVLGSRGEDIKFIKDEVELATALLKDMTLSSQSTMEEYSSSEQLKQWLKQVKDLICEAEDAIDEFMYHVARGGGSSRNGSVKFNPFADKKFHLPRKLKACYRMASRLRNLKLMANKVKERRERYKFPAVAASLGDHVARQNGALHDPRMRALTFETDPFVGIVEQRNMIIKWLVNDDGAPQLRVISIVGPGGMGKTTLAMQCYDSPMVTDGHFSCRGRITVSQSFDFNKLMKSLVKQCFGAAARATTEMMEADELVMELRKQLEDKRYMVFVDDVWSVGAWNAFCCAFPDCGTGSRIIVTTRIDAVAHTCSLREPRYIHRIQPLPLEQSRELFCKRVFYVPPFSCPPNLEDLMKGILKKCGGMPLAIVTIAGILAAKHQRSKDQWQRVHDGIGHEWEAGARNMKRILMLSYNDLPDYIKPCFLYLSVFPEDWKIKRSHLVRRWIAEGLVDGRGDAAAAEQIAKSYFNELENRHLIDPAIVKCGEIKRWKIHDLVHETLAERAVDENFVCIVDKNFKTRIPRDSKIRRISVHGTNNLLNDLDVSLARSLSLNFPSNEISEWPMLNFREMRLLRMLDLEGCKFIKDQHIEQICGKLVLLKHLCLRSLKISKIPDSIKMLQNLTTLDIRDTRVRELPRALVKLKQLRNLYTSTSVFPYTTMDFPRGLRSMESLQFLDVTIVSDIKVVEGLGQLTQLHMLDIVLIHTSTSLTAFLKQKLLSTIEKLSSSLRYFRIKLLPSDRDSGDLNFMYGLSSPPLKLEILKLNGMLSENGVPRWIESLHHVTKMLLELSGLKEEDIRRLGRLPSLVILHLNVRDHCIQRGEGSFFDDDDEEERERPQKTYGGCELISIGSLGFANLNVLSLEFRLAKGQVGFRQGAMPNLEFLHLNETRVADGIPHLAALKEVIYVGHRAEIEGLRKATEAHANNPKLNILRSYG